jgi:hypothetical protein
MNIIMKDKVGKNCSFQFAVLWSETKKNTVLLSISIILTITRCSDISLMKSKEEKYGQLDDYFSFHSE